MPLDADIYGYKEAITPSLAVSTALHAALLAFLVLVPHLLSHSGERAGATTAAAAAVGGAMSAKLVSGIPLPPKPNANPQNVLATENPGCLTRSLRRPQSKRRRDSHRPSRTREQGEAQARKGKSPVANPQGRAPRKRRSRALTPSKPRPSRSPRSITSIPFGEGGPVAGPYTSVQIGRQHRRNEVRRRRQRQLRQPLRLVHRHRGQQGSSGVGERSQPEC